LKIVHYPVLAQETLQYLPLDDDKEQLMIDCTLGEGGHSHLFLKKYPNLRVIGLDRDAAILEKAKLRLKEFGSRFEGVNTWFDTFLENYEGPRPNIILFDLGISIFHYEESKRGFSFNSDEKLDMRLDVTSDLTAFDVVNYYKEKELADLIFKYGEERYSRKIAASIVRNRAIKPIDTAGQLADIIKLAVPPSYRYGKISPATRTFQAIRIEVNEELKRIPVAIKSAVKLLEDEGRIAVISFHSLEDRPVKHLFRELAKEDEQKQASVKILTKKPIRPTELEIQENPPSRSAKLRVAQKLGAHHV
jgi:16S rRNA (cytosine1402-N4)-methyltransferase